MDKPPAASADSSAGRLFGRSEFAADEKETIRRLLEQKLGKDLLAERQGAGGSKYTYIESHKAIQLANQIFGFNGWSSSVVDVTPDFIEESPGKFTVGVTAVVKVLLKDGTYHEDVGYGVGENPRKGEAIEKAKKEAVTDARKRALRLFGNALGNCIYDKQHVKKHKNERTDVHGFVVEPARPPLMPQNMPQPQHAVPAPAAAAVVAGEGDTARRATVNYSPPQAPPPRPTLAPTAAAAMAAAPPPPRVAAPPPPVQTAHTATAAYHQVHAAPIAGLPPVGAQVTSGDVEYYDHDLPDA